MSSSIRLSGNHVVVEGELVIFDAAAAKDSLFEALHAIEDPIVLDLAAVTEIDTAGLQLLLVARREAAKTMRRLEIAAASDAVREALDLCGLRDAFASTATGEPRT